MADEAIRGLVERLRERADTMNGVGTTYPIYHAGEITGQAIVRPDARVGYYANSDAALDRAVADALSSLQPKVEELERERDSARELMSASVEDYNDALAEKRAAEAKVERMAEALKVAYEVVDVCAGQNVADVAWAREVRSQVARALAEVKP